jgi:hypothetical protein
MTGSDEYPRYDSHVVPRSTGGRFAVALFLLLLLLAEPPVVFAVANRIEPLLLGLPFLFAWLLLVYTALIIVLLLAARRIR